MCGFFVVYNKQQNNLNREKFFESGDLIKHRGRMTVHHILTKKFQCFFIDYL